MTLPRREDWFGGTDLWESPPPVRLRRFLTIGLTILLMFSSCAKNQIVGGLRQAGVIDPAQRESMTVDIICDFGGGSSGCTADSLRDVLMQTASTLPAGSVLRLHGMADQVFDAKELARSEITAPKKKTRHAIAAHRNRQTKEIVDTFLTAAAPLFTNDDRRASPIAETIARAVLAGNPSGGVHHIIVLTDARQVSKASPSLGRLDFECGNLPSTDDFAQRLSHLFGTAPNGIAIHFAYVRLEPVANNRCDATIERYEAIKRLWTESLSRLGADVTWSMTRIETL